MGDEGRHSKLELFCAAAMEAGWLTAAVIIPVFFNLYTARIFEPDKIALLRSVAMMMACAWLICLIERGESARQYLTGKLRNPVFLSALAVIAVSLVATATSVAPGFSFFGSYRRMQGTYTTLCTVIIFAIIFLEMRTRRQANRLFTAIILGSLPVAFYGIIQRFGMDPLTWNFDVANRASSTMGNPIFTGAYLCIVSLLTLGRIGSDLNGVRKSAPSLPDILRVGSYGLAALAQILALAGSGSRGPWIGWLAGMFFFLLLFAVLSRRRRLIQGFIAAGALGIAVLLALNLNISPLANLRTVPYLSPFSHLLESERGTGKIRTLIWEGTVRLLLPHPSIRYPDGGKDPLNTVRPLIGYGPETMNLIYSQFYPPEIGHYEYRTLLIDRSHNHVWDTLVSTGLLGLIAYQALLISLFLFGLRRIGLLSTGREQGAFLGLWIGTGIAGGLAAILLQQPKYFALGFALGTAAGMILCLLVTAMPSARRARTDRLGGESRILIASLLAAILANYIEVQFGISVAGSQSLFWLAAGLLVAIGSGGLRAEDDLPSAADPASRQAAVPRTGTPGKRNGPPPCLPPAGGDLPRGPLLHRIIGAGVGYSLLNALILAALFFVFVSNHARLNDPLAILWRSLTAVAPSSQTSPAALSLVIAVWVLSSLIAACELSRGGLLRSASDWIIALALLASSSLGMALSFALPLANQLKNLASSPVAESIRISESIIGIYDFFFLALAVTVLLTGLTLLFDEKAPRRAFRHPWILLPLLPPLLWGGYAGISYANLNPIRADILLREGAIHQARNRPDEAIAHFQRAVALWPSDICYAKLGGALANRAVSAEPASGHRPDAPTRLSEVMRLDPRNMRNLTRADLFSAARTVLLHALELNPLYADHSINLARVYHRWTSLTTAAQEKTRLADQTSAFYEQATTISPQNVRLWNESALFTLDQKNDSDSAVKTIEKSLALDPRFDQTYLAAGTIYLKRQQWSRAGDFFRTALSLTPDLAEAYDKLAFVYYVQGNYTEAIAANKHVLRIMPADPGIWKTHKNLAILYGKIGDPRSARLQAEQAFARVPAASRQELEAVREAIGVPVEAAGKSAPAGR
ncbi:MAG: tetratricopeptide repeat protein [Syntrophales bacterium]